MMDVTFILDKSFFHELDLYMHCHGKTRQWNVNMTDYLSLDIVLYHVCINRCV